MVKNSCIVKFKYYVFQVLLEGKIRPVSQEECKEKFKPFRNGMKKKDARESRPL